MKIKKNRVVADIDQLILMLSIPQIQNLVRNIRESEPECIAIIISFDLMNIEKREN
jgi:hypothetical protein